METAKNEITKICRMIIEKDEKVTHRQKHINWVAVEIALFGVIERFQKRLFEEAPQPEDKEK